MIDSQHRPTKIDDLPVLNPGIDDMTGVQIVALKGGKSHRMVSGWLQAAVNALVVLGQAGGLNAAVAIVVNGASSIAAQLQTATEKAAAAALSAQNAEWNKFRGVVTLTGATANLALDHVGKVVRRSHSAANTITVPPDTDVAWPSNVLIHINQVPTSQPTTIVPGAGVTIESFDDLDTLGGPNAWATLIRLDTNKWGLTGNLI